MCREMAGAAQSQQMATEKLTKQLAVAVRSVQWSYAIFWSQSTEQQGLLEWVDGYYNGDIKTRKTVPAMELKNDKIGLQRSEQLRELYESLLEGEIDQQAKRPTAALSPEDLSDAEWYYLVCMSFVFNPGQSLPGKAFTNKETIWLCNAQYADSKVFSRSLLAKCVYSGGLLDDCRRLEKKFSSCRWSFILRNGNQAAHCLAKRCQLSPSSILWLEDFPHFVSSATVVCFPHLDGVIELGVTELVAEDPNLIQHVKASLLDFSKPVCCERSFSTLPGADDDNDPACVQANQDTVDPLALFENLYTPTEDIILGQEGIVELNINTHRGSTKDSPDDCSNIYEHNNHTEDSMLEDLNEGASNIQSWHLMDDEISNGFLDSINSSNCTSEAFMNEERTFSSPKDNNVTQLHLKELQDGNHTKLSSLDLGANDDLHYRRTLCLLMGSSIQSIGNSCFSNRSCKSSFVTWKKEAVNGQRPQVRQNVLKKILLTVPLMHGGHSLGLHKENGGKVWHRKPESIKTCKGLSDKQRENEKFLVLKSMIPTVDKIDKAAILDDMIRYLKELEARVEELESCKDSKDYCSKTRRNHLDMAEQISDNYDNNSGNGKKLWVNKRKVCDMYGTDPEPEEEDSLPSDVKVSMRDKEVLIELKCAYREYILLDIMDEINNLHLDVHSVQSSTIDGILILNLKSKFRGAAVAPARMIKQALWKIGCKS